VLLWPYCGPLWRRSEVAPIHGAVPGSLPSPGCGNYAPEATRSPRLPARGWQQRGLAEGFRPLRELRLHIMDAVNGSLSRAQRLPLGPAVPATAPHTLQSFLEQTNFEVKQ